jgi:hypothetical protein
LLEDGITLFVKAFDALFAALDKNMRADSRR